MNTILNLFFYFLFSVYVLQLLSSLQRLCAGLIKSPIGLIHQQNVCIGTQDKDKKNSKEREISSQVLAVLQAVKQNERSRLYVPSSLFHFTVDHSSLQCKKTTLEIVQYCYVENFTKCGSFILTVQENHICRDCVVLLC